MSEKKFAVIGVSDSEQLFLTPEAERVIRAGKVFSGGRRHHEIVGHLLPPGAVWIDITAPLADVFRQYVPHASIVVFASGDPLFYGFAVTLQREFPTAEMTVFPSFNSLQMLAHRLLLPYSDLTAGSLTGRPWDDLDAALIDDRRLIGLLTDRKKTPAAIAARMLRYGYDNYTIAVGECLGNRAETVRTMTLREATVTDFAYPNCVILRMTHGRERFFGIQESRFAHLDNRANMITKMPVRLVALSMLGLPGKSVMWDVGFCTGSVSIEAKLRFPRLKIVAFERREESRRLLDENCRRFGAPGIEGVIADFMECDLSGYPAPDAVFMGGHGGRLGEMVVKIFRHLRPGGTLVFNSVSDESCAAFAEAVGNAGRRLVGSHLIRLDSHNPITIMKAQ